MIRHDLPPDLSKPTGNASFIANVVVAGALMMVTAGMLVLGMLQWAS